MGTFIGTSGADTLNGTGENDFISGGNGDDVLNGMLGDDYIIDGLGDDIVDGGGGNDTIQSHDGGADALNGGAGDDRISVVRWAGRSETFTVSGGEGKDRIDVKLFGANQADVDAGDGDDFIELTGMEGQYRLTLGGGSDTLAIWARIPTGSTVSVTVADFQPGEAGDRLDFHGLFLYTFTNWDHNQNPFGTGHLRLVQDGANARLEMDDNGGGDAFRALITFTNADASLFTSRNLDGFPADGSVPAGIVITGTEARDDLVGTGGNDTINGLGERDSIFGGSGNDVIDGGGEGDTIDGEGGDDTIDGGDGDDWIEAGYGNDLIRGGAGGDGLTSLWGGNDTLEGGTGNDTIDIQRSGVGADLVTADGGIGNDRLRLAAYGANNRFELNGGDGDDIVTLLWLGGTADITLGTGRDTLSFEDTQLALVSFGKVIVRDFELGAAGDQLNFDSWLANVLIDWDGSSNPFGTGHVRLVQDADGAGALLQVDRDGQGTIFAHRTVVTFSGLQAGDFTADNLDGFNADGTPPQGKVLTGTASHDTLTGTAGNDTIDGLEGSDILVGGSGADLMHGGSGGDRLEGGLGNDTLYGDGDNDILEGQAGDDILFGGLGADIIHLGYGSDTASGGDGNDTFYFYQTGTPGLSSTLYGEGGDDVISIRSYNVAHLTADAGAGADSVFLGQITGSAHLILGAGADQIRFENDFLNLATPNIVTVADFNAAAGGDVIQLASILAGQITGWEGNANPFATGHLRLVQSGTDTLIQIDRNGGGDAFQTFMKLQALSAATLSVGSLGFAPGAIYGTDGADLMGGSAGDDLLIGGGGDDIYHVNSALDVVTEAAGGGTDTVVTALGSKSDFAELYVLPAHVENLTGSATNGQGVRGSAANNVIAMGAGGDLVVLDDGGDDIVSGGGGNDFFYFGGAFSAADKTDGGAGTDTIGLLGTYALTLGADSLKGVERLALYTGQPGSGGTANGYAITTNDANVAAGQELFVTAASLAASETLTFIGSAETDGRFKVLGGGGADTVVGGGKGDHLAGAGGRDNLYGMAGNDTLFGGAGGDVLNGGVGADTYLYMAASESTGTGFDRIEAFQAAMDKIDLPFAVSGWTGSVGGSLSDASFDTDLAAAVNGTLEAFSAVLFRPDGGGHAGKTFVVVDANGDGSYQAGQDYVLQFVNPVQPLDVAPPLFI